MSDSEPLVSTLKEGKAQFLALVADIRPELHRYCARMSGSVADGEDIVQDTLARAYYALSELESVPALRPWLFQIAHNRAIDHLRRYERRHGSALDELASEPADNTPDPEDTLAQQEATRLAVGRFTALPPVQRSAVILKDVLGHTAEEIGELLELSVAATKSAIHRGRQSLRSLATEGRPELERATSPEIARYVALFNARDWDAVRAMLAEDVRLDLVSRARRAGRRDVSQYFSNYDALTGWRLAPAWLDGREVIAVYRETPGTTQPSYFVELTFERGSIAFIKDFRYVPYIASEANIQLR